MCSTGVRQVGQSVWMNQVGSTETPWCGTPPDRAAVEALWAAVAAGSVAREVAHDWSVPWVEDDARSDDTMVNTAMAHLHGFDMVSRDPDRPSLLHHGPPGVYYRTLEQVQQDLDHWRRECSKFDQDPAAWRAERLALARAAVEAYGRGAFPDPLTRFESDL